MPHNRPSQCRMATPSNTESWRSPKSPLSRPPDVLSLTFNIIHLNVAFEFPRHMEVFSQGTSRSITPPFQIGSQNPAEWRCEDTQRDNLQGYSWGGRLEESALPKWYLASSKTSLHPTIDSHLSVVFDFGFSFSLFSLIFDFCFIFIKGIPFRKIIVGIHRVHRSNLASSGLHLFHHHHITYISPSSVYIHISNAHLPM